jgi:hypothetical protein
LKFRYTTNLPQPFRNNLLEKGWAKKQPFKKRLDQKLQPMGEKLGQKLQPFKKRLDQKLQPMGGKVGTKITTDGEKTTLNLRTILISF